MNLYEKVKAGLYPRRQPTCPSLRVFTTQGRLGWHTYHVIDPDGREIALTRDAAVVAHSHLGALLKAYK